jgi:hypothetical protein
MIAQTANWFSARILWWCLLFSGITTVKATEYEVDGVIEQTIYSQDGDVQSQQRSKFTVYVKNCSWLIDTTDHDKAGNFLTTKRLDYLCGIFANSSPFVDTSDVIASALGPIITGGTWFNSSFNYPRDYYSPWEIFGLLGIKEGGDCITEATLMKYQLDMLGVEGSKTFHVYPCHANWNALKDNDPEINGPGNNLIYYYLYQNQPVPNAFEGCCVYGQQYWPGGVGMPYTSAYEVLAEVAGPSPDGGYGTANHQAWESQNDWETFVGFPNTTPPSD